MTIDRLTWDSEFFGRNIGRWRTEGPLPEAHPDPTGFDLIYVECAPTSDGTMAPPHWFNAGEKVTFSTPASSGPSPPSIHTLHDRTPELEALVWMSGHQSRYRLDPGFTEAEFQRLYSRWLDACLEGQWNATILGHLHHGVLTGFITVESMDDHGRIGLVAVHPEHRGQGIAGQLVAAAKTEAHRKAHTELRVSTQGANHAAIAAYLRAGFKAHHGVQQYHWWVQQAP